MYDFLSSTIRAAAHELMQRQGGQLKTMTKSDTSLVTEADLASEKLIIAEINKYFKDDIIISEESGKSSGQGPYVWIVDPLDGTTNYANGYPYFCISMARGHFTPTGDLILEHAAIFDPNRDRLYYAQRGQGAHVNGKALQVAPFREFTKCFLSTGFYYMREAELQKEIARFARVAQACSTIRRDGAAALDLAYTAEGVYDAFWELGLAPWDVAAGALLIQEAGGVIRNYNSLANKFDVFGQGVIAGQPAAVETIGTLLSS